MYSSPLTYSYASINNPTHIPSKAYNDLWSLGSIILLDDIPTIGPTKAYPPPIPIKNNSCNCPIERNNNYGLIVGNLIASTLGSFLTFIMLFYKFYYKKKFPKRKPITNNYNFGTQYNSDF